MSEATRIQRKAAPEQIEARLRYIADMSGELASIAGGLRLPMLTYFLNMARVEAEMQIGEMAPSRARSEPRRRTHL